MGLNLLRERYRVDLASLQATCEANGEDIRVHVWPLEDALQAVRDGRINNAASIIALQWLALNRAEVRGLWA